VGDVTHKKTVYTNRFEKKQNFMKLQKCYQDQDFCGDDLKNRILMDTSLYD